MAAKSKIQWDAAPKAPRADSKLKTRPELEQEGWWLLRNPQDGETTPYTLEALAVQIQDDIGCEVSLRAVSEWQSWYALKLRMERAEERALQARMRLAADPDVTTADLDRIAQRVFTVAALEEEDVKAWATVKKVQHGEEKLQQGKEKIAQGKRKLEQADTKLSQEARRIVLLEEAAREAKSKLLAITSAAKTKGGLTPETLAEIEAAAGLL